MSIRHVQVLAALVVISAGCAAPEPPQKINAYLPKNVPIGGADAEACSRADTFVLAQCTQRIQYADAIKGDRVDTWYFVKWKVLSVGRGKWPQDTMSFVFYQKRPISKSGVLLSATPLPYYVGAVRAFCLNTGGVKPQAVVEQPSSGGTSYAVSTQSNAVIVAEQPRSRIPPHDPIQWPIFDARDPESNKLIERVREAALAFLQKQGVAVTTADVTEQYGLLYVVEAKMEDRSYAVVVNGDRLAAGWADPAEAVK